MEKEKNSPFPLPTLFCIASPDERKRKGEKRRREKKAEHETKKKASHNIWETRRSWGHARNRIGRLAFSCQLPPRVLAWNFSKTPPRTG